jgi:hypothetical protein
MSHTKKVRFTVPAGSVPTIEFDSSVMAWYVRFRNGKVAKTIADDTPGHLYTIDLDDRNQVIGFEILGVKQFTIEMLRKWNLVDTSKVNFDKARFTPVGCGEVTA